MCACASDVLQQVLRHARMRIADMVSCADNGSYRELQKVLFEEHPQDKVAVLGRCIPDIVTCQGRKWLSEKWKRAFSRHVHCHTWVRSSCLDACLQDRDSSAAVRLLAACLKRPRRSSRRFIIDIELC